MLGLADCTFPLNGPVERESLVGELGSEVSRLALRWCFRLLPRDDFCFRVLPVATVEEETRPALPSALKRRSSCDGRLVSPLSFASPEAGKMAELRLLPPAILPAKLLPPADCSRIRGELPGKGEPASEAAAELFWELGESDKCASADAAALPASDPADPVAGGGAGEGEAEEEGIGVAKPDGASERVFADVGSAGRNFGMEGPRPAVLTDKGRLLTVELEMSPLLASPSSRAIGVGSSSGCAIDEELWSPATCPASSASSSHSSSSPIGSEH